MTAERLYKRVTSLQSYMNLFKSFGLFGCPAKVVCLIFVEGDITAKVMERWLCSKTISDCAKALLGAYYVGGGLPAALAFIKWLGIDTEFEPDVVEEAIRTASGWTYLPKIHEIETLESKIGYKFTVKGLLLESITHASQQELGVFFCYQRLEFLGDSVLDLLITWHLFQRYKDIDPGELTDLRSASVNNENLAHKVAVRHKLQQHLQHNSGLLLEKITEFVKRLEDSDENKYMLLSNGTSKVPKVLGDMVESIAGAVLIDTKLDLDKVWEIFEPLLSPIATPENLELPPLRELTELCSHHGYFLNTTCTNEGDMYEKGFLHSRYASKGMQAEEKIASHKEYVEKSCSLMLDIEIPMPAKHDEVVNSKNVSGVRVKVQKGGPRTTLHELCKRCQWPMPTFETVDWKPSHQLAVYEVALRTNTIAVLETGSGKTMISIMLVKHFGEELKKRGDQRLILFLAPTVHLVVQQYETIKVHTDLDVQYYCGAKAVDAWSIACWQKEVFTYQVMVMTPQILLDVLRKGFLNLDMVHLMVIDECHHAWGNHPYNRLMKEFYHKSVLKPHIFGMTASPILRKELEAILDSKICTVADRSEINMFVPLAKEVNRYYDAKLFIHEEFKTKLRLLLDKYDASLVQLGKSSLDNYNDSDDIIKASKKDLSNYYDKICHCMDELGLVCAIEATKICIDAVSSSNSADCHDFVMVIVAQCKSFLEEVLQKLAERLPEDFELLLKTENDCGEAVQKGYISSKLYELIQIIRSLGIPSQVVCLIFVERDITAKVMESGNLQQRDLLFDIIKSKHSTVDIALNRDQDSLVSRVSIDEDLGAYYVDSTGASVTAESSVSLINTYCQNLPRDKYFTPKPIFRFTLDGEYYECTITLPPNAAIQTIVGPANQNSHVAKKLACLEACKRLHQSGALNDHLLPCVQEHLNDVKAEKTGESAKGAGTTKRKELHGTTMAHAMSGTWAHQNDGIILQGYKLNFSCNRIGENYSAFILLTDAILDQDVACKEIDLYLIDKMVKADISPCGPIALDKKQVDQGKLFQELFFNGLFGKLFTGSKSSGVSRKFLLSDDRSLWNTSNMYMLLPLDSSCAHKHDKVSINWKAISASASVVKFMREIYSSRGQNGPVVDSKCGSSEAGGSTPDMIHLANRFAELHSLKGVVVLAIHTGRIYCVLDVVTGLTADSPFDGNSRKQSSDTWTFAEYFNKKYGIVLQHPRQPLLLLKSSHNPHNLLSSKPGTEGNFILKRSNGKNVALNHVHMPPELLVDIDVPYEVLKSFYLLPSLMYRVESLMLACQLRKEISFCSSNPIPSFLILEAITTLRCCEDFSMERLELLGDSVLKYAVSCSLFLKFPGKHEGKLSSDRIKIIRNATLHSLGTKRGIQGYIRDAAFEPRRWVAPGHISIHRVPCKCGLNDNEVLNRILDTNSNKSIVIGKACDRGHRWLCSKTISDCVEALIGAYYVGGGLPAALAFIKWLGIDTEFEPDMVEEAIRTASGWTYLPKIHEIETLESKIGYKFTVKGLLLESITHASQQELGVFFCYQRLEFLGDSVLDLLITWHLFQRYKDIDPGELTDLRSASVNNENFAQVAVRHKLQQHLQHNSGLLLEQITEFVKRLEDSYENKYMLLSNGSSKVPKVLGDMVESIAGAVLIDTKLDLDKVWEIFEPLLSPIATPENLELPPLRELTELCSHHGYFLNTTCTNEGDMNVAVLEVQLEDVLLVREGREKNKKAAKGQAAYLLLKDLEEKGFLHSRYASKGTQAEEKIASHKESVEKSCSLMLDIEIPMPAKHDEVVNSKNVSGVGPGKPVALTVKMQKGGPRTALYELCKRCQWPMPTFETVDWKPSGDQMDECTGGGDANRHMFVSGITLHIPNSTIIKRKGDRRPDKKSSQDSAALTMLYELDKQGRCQIEVQQPTERIS
ncbi:Ribonuclease III domain [Musa troglodytarum]|uniref:Ribonuclease III domain n=1 Tax=Musa troglodytarum TaxID=320322 RepID=A0A9E7I7B1_9LILI|nr:Ribonuclease III domain [Musa troglodytarum]